MSASVATLNYERASSDAVLADIDGPSLFACSLSSRRSARDPNGLHYDLLAPSVLFGCRKQGLSTGLHAK